MIRWARFLLRAEAGCSFSNLVAVHISWTSSIRASSVRHICKIIIRARHTHLFNEYKFSNPTIIPTLISSISAALSEYMAKNFKPSPVTSSLLPATNGLESKSSDDGLVERIDDIGKRWERLSDAERKKVLDDDAKFEM